MIREDTVIFDNTYYMIIATNTLDHCKYYVGGDIDEPKWVPYRAQGYCYVDLESAQCNWESVKPFLTCQEEYTDFAIIKVRTTETVKQLIH